MTSTGKNTVQVISFCSFSLICEVVGQKKTGETAGNLRVEDACTCDAFCLAVSGDKLYISKTGG